MKTFNKIRDWAEARGIYEKGNVKTQYIKLINFLNKPLSFIIT